MKFKWELLTSGTNYFTSRAKVIGGWLVLNKSADNGENVSETMVFIADPNHSWSIEE